MKFSLKTNFFWYSIIPILLFSACSSTKNISSEKNQSQKTVKVQPKRTPWYQMQKNFYKKGGWYYAFASCISTDSLRAMDKAKQNAKLQLNSGMQTSLENLRTSLAKEEGKDALANKPYFIWLMRGATYHQLNKAVENRSKIFLKNGIYQAYVEMKYSRKQLISDLFEVLSKNETYKNSVQKSQAFTHWYSSLNQADSTKATD